jgi:HEAT repeat protein
MKIKLLPLILILLLSCFGCGPKKTIEYQGKTLRQWEWKAVSDNPEDRIAAAKALGKLGPKNGLSSLVRLLSDKNQRVKFAAELAVMEMGKTAVPYLTNLLHSPDKEVRTNAYKALIRTLVDMRKEGVQPLANLLKDSDPKVRIAAVNGLVQADPKNRALIPTIDEALKTEENPHVRKAYNLALVTIKAQQGRSKKYSPTPFTMPTSK